MSIQWGGLAGVAARQLPLLRALASYRVSYLTSDLIAGLTLAAIAIPEQMATARLGGFSPHVGFYAFIAGSVGFAVLGGNRFLSCGADSTITPIFAGSVALLATSGTAGYQATAEMLALIVGAVVLAAGLLRLGWIANLLSLPVMTGFLAGIAVHILASQLPAVLGLPPPTGSTITRLVQLADNSGGTNPYTLAIGLGVFAAIIISEAISARIPGALIGLAGATFAVATFGLEEHGIEVVGSVPSALPHLIVPQIAAEQWRSIIPLSLLVALVVMLQTAATTRSFPSDPDSTPDVDRDFVGVGAGSIVAGLIGAFPVNASPPRTGVVSQSGGKSQLAGLFAAALVLAILAFGATLLQHVPEAALGGVLLFVATRIIRFRQIAMISQQSFSEFLLIVATAAAIIALPIEQGVAIGIILSLLNGVWNVTRSRVVAYERVPGTTVWWPPTEHMRGERDPDIIVAGFQAPLFFLNASLFRTDMFQLLRSAARKPKLLVIEASGILEIDFTAAQILIDLVNSCHRDGIVVAVARLESLRAQQAFARFHIDDVVGRDHIFLSVDHAVQALPHLNIPT